MNHAPAMPQADGPGRTCPVSYSYGASALRTDPVLQTDAVWIAGGLYGNPFVLDSLLEQYEAEPGRKHLVFNGDFHWFDVDPAMFARVNDGVLKHIALRGNVETELATPTDDAGCGCGYPEWVDGGTVERSNRILLQLRETALAVSGTQDQLARLPMRLRAQVGSARIGVVHGDANGLAGWNFAQETLATSPGRKAASAAFAAAEVDVFASTHTCLPVMQGFEGDRLLINNGSAGMSNFSGTKYGVATRIAKTPAQRPLYEARCRGVYVAAIAIEFDYERWRQAFCAMWPDGSDAHLSYFHRITEGPGFTHSDAVRSSRAGRQTA